MTETNGPPSNPSFEVDAALDADVRKIGDVWRSLKTDDDVNRIMKEMDWAGPGPVYSYRTYINALRGESLPKGQVLALQCSRQIASFIRRHTELSPDTKQTLNARRQQCDNIAEDYEEPDPLPSEEQAVPSPDPVGVYVYTYPHYLNHPVASKPDADSTPRTFLKVGKSDIDIEVRIAQQATTAFPERPLKLRLYQGDDDPALIEKKIHATLNAADHNPNKRKGAGKEWFLTNLKFLDMIAGMLELDVHRYNDDKTTELEA